MPIEHSEITPIRTRKVPQTIETPVTFEDVPGAYVRFAYARSSDSMANQIEGQDYLCFRHNDQRLVFVVADGVGSSFCGNLASRILGDHLLDWLWSLDATYLGGAAALQEAATSYLNRIQKQAQLEVEEHELPDAMSPLIKQALESQRDYGSEAIFAACRIDYPGPYTPDGLVSVFWMGDTHIHVLGLDGADIDLGGSWENANRWSTAKGTRGTLFAWMDSLQGVGRVSAYSDGLSAHAPHLLDYADDRLDREIHLGARLPTSDDVAFIDVVLRTPVYEGYPDPNLPDPNLERPHLEPIWNPTGEPEYELRWSLPGQSGRVSFIIQEASTPALNESRTINVPHGETSWKPGKPQPPGHYYYRVRAVKRFGGVTPWSSLHQTRVAHPLPEAPVVHPVEPEKAAVLHWEGESDTLEYVVQRAADPDFEDAQVVFEGRSLAWAVPTHQPGTFYFRVKAVSDGGEGPWSDAQEVVIKLPPPPTPHLAAASYGFIHGEYELRWQPVPNATHYELEKVDTADIDAQPEIILAEQTIFNVDSEPVGHYIYRVRACHDYGCSAWSVEQAVIIAPIPPTTAPDLAIEGPGEDGVVRLSWSDVPSADEYLVEVANERDFTNARVFAQTHRLLEITRRQPGSYYFRVCASNRGGDGPWSEVASFEVVPNAPGWIEARAEGGKIAVTWESVGSVTYRLERTAGADDAAFVLVYSGEETHFETPAPGYAVRFRVRAENSDARSGWVTSQQVSTGTPATTPVLESPALTDRGELRIVWSPVEGAAAYLLEAARDPAFSIDVDDVRVENTGVNFRPPSAGKYWFRVRAIRSTITGEKKGDPGPVIAIEVESPAAPRLWPLDPVPADAEYEITWGGVRCKHYELQESETGDFAGDGMVQTMRIFHPVQKMLMPGRKPGLVYYRVRSVDEQEKPSRWSNVLTLTITGSSQKLPSADN